MSVPAAFLRKFPLLQGSKSKTYETARLPTITRRMALLVLVTILPALAFSGFMIVRYAQVQRAQYVQQLRATVRAISLAIDTDILRHFAILVTLENSRELKGRDWRAFYDLAKAAIDEPNAWIVVFDPSAQQVLSTFAPYGTVLPRSGNPYAIHRVVETMQPYVSDLFVGALSKLKTVAIYIPIIENDAVVNVIAFSFPAVIISRILHSQMQVPGGIASVVDRNEIVIARTFAEADSVGRRATPDFIAATSRAAEGLFETHSLEGPIIHGAYVKSTVTGWTFALGVRQVVLEVAAVALGLAVCRWRCSVGRLRVAMRPLLRPRYCATAWSPYGDGAVTRAGRTLVAEKTWPSRDAGHCRSNGEGC